eukprot:g47038.t1
MDPTRLLDESGASDLEKAKSGLLVASVKQSDVPSPVPEQGSQDAAGEAVQQAEQAAPPQETMTNNGAAGAIALSTDGKKHFFTRWRVLKLPEGTQDHSIEHVEKPVFLTPEEVAAKNKVYAYDGPERHADQGCVKYIKAFLYYFYLLIFTLTFGLPVGLLMMTLFLLQLFFFGLIPFLIYRGLCRSCTKPQLPEFTEKSIFNIVPNSVPMYDNLMFGWHRKTAYIKPFAMALPKWLAGKFSFSGRSPLISDQDFFRMLNDTLLVHDYYEDMVDSGRGYIMDAQGLTKVPHLNKTIFEIDSVGMDQQGWPRYIKLLNGEMIRPDEPGWDLAKKHVSGTILTLGAAFTHSWIHFVFPDLAAIGMHKLKGDSVLYKLLFPHLRYVTVINQVRNHQPGQADSPIGWDGKCCGMGNGKWQSYIPWQALGRALTLEAFVTANDSHCSRFYYQDGLPPAPIKPDFKDQSNFFHNKRYDRLSDFVIPDYAQITNTRYHTFVSSYWPSFRRLVEKVWPEIKKEDYDLWVSTFYPWLPTVKNADPIDVLACVMWHVSVLHSCDHQSYLPFQRWISVKPVKKWDPQDFKDTYRTFHSNDILSTWTFFDVWQRPLYNPLKPNLLYNVDHGFRSAALRKADAEFRADLASNEKELIAKKLNLIPLGEIIVALHF